MPRHYMGKRGGSRKKALKEHRRATTLGGVAKSLAKRKKKGSVTAAAKKKRTAKPKPTASDGVVQSRKREGISRFFLKKGDRSGPLGIVARLAKRARIGGKRKRKK